ncbi:MAG: branched-chain amino acid ABC transporter permease [Candidatus Bathyarchaeia archaeon]|nr:branched-chain amino acid ABC transporter permease [Candidatus Bathyarchaeota archaeon]
MGKITKPSKIALKIQKWIVWLAIATLIITPFIVKEAFITHIFISALLYGTLGAAFDFAVGYLGIVNFGYAAFMGLGAYTSAIAAIRFGINPWLGLLLGGVAAGLLGLLTGLMTLRLYGLFVACFTWFLGMALMFLIAVTPEITRGYLGLTVPPFPDVWLLNFKDPLRLSYYSVIILLSLPTLFILYYLGNRSKMGLAFKALRGSEPLAIASGINPLKYRLINFTITCFIAGLFGSFYAHYIKILTPSLLATGKTIEILSIAYIGGRGSLWGSIPAAFITISFLEVLRPLEAYRFIIYGILLILIMIFYPGGLARLITRKELF